MKLTEQIVIKVNEETRAKLLAIATAEERKHTEMGRRMIVKAISDWEAANGEIK